MISKSANYCCASTHFPVGLVVLAEVAIGTPLELPASDYNAGKRAKTEGFHSTKGVGKTAPNPSEFVKTEDGVLVPCGKPMDHKIESELLYNEYIVYDPSQVRQRYVFLLLCATSDDKDLNLFVRYLCQVRFHFK